MLILFSYTDNIIKEITTKNGRREQKMSERFSELIKNFDKIRDYMRDFYIYGFKTRSDYSYKSLRTYDNERRRIESWLGELIRFDNSRKGKQVSISCDSGQLAENPLFSAYRCKSFTDNDIRLHFFILDILADGGSCTVDEITDRICDDYGAYFEPQTIRLKLKEYVNAGIIIPGKSGRTLTYRLSDDRCGNFCSDRRGFIDMISFFMGTAPFGVIGGYILRHANEENDIFLNKHSFIVHTLEDNILLELVDAMKEKRYISVVNFGKRQKETTLFGLAIRIHVSTVTGRRYLVMYLPDSKRFNTVRLDYIRSVKAENVCEKYDFYKEKYGNNLSKCRGMSFGRRSNDTGYHTVKMALRLDEEKEQFIIGRLEREGRDGKITKLDEGHYEYETGLFDAGEISPWVKSFTGRIERYECTDKNIENRFVRDIERMHKMYGEVE